MIRNIIINNYRSIEHLDIPFGPMNAFIGQTIRESPTSSEPWIRSSAALGLETFYGPRLLSP